MQKKRLRLLLHNTFTSSQADIAFAWPGGGRSSTCMVSERTVVSSHLVGCSGMCAKGRGGARGGCYRGWPGGRRCDLRCSSGKHEHVVTGTSCNLARLPTAHLSHLPQYVRYDCTRPASVSWEICVADGDGVRTAASVHELGGRLRQQKRLL